MPKSRHWKDMSPQTRRLIVVVGSVDAGLRFWSLADLRKRSSEDVNGSKRAWRLALMLVNSAGVVPVLYLTRGRRSRSITKH